MSASDFATQEKASLSFSEEPGELRFATARYHPVSSSATSIPESTDADLIGSEVLNFQLSSDPTVLTKALVQARREIVRKDSEISSLRDLGSRVAKLESDLETLTQEESQEIIALREIDDASAEEEIRQLYKSSGQTLYFSDISSQLRLEIRQVVRICKSLLDSGYITEDATD